MVLLVYNLFQNNIIPGLSSWGVIVCDFAAAAVLRIVKFVLLLQPQISCSDGALVWQ
jgi:hypothetical protein